MADNVIKFPDVNGAELKAERVAWLREFADVYEADDSDGRVAFAVFAAQGNQVAVQAHGFQSDSEALRYFSAWIKNHGVA